MSTVLGVVRQSRQPKRQKAEDGNSVAEQKRRIRAWAELHDHDVIGWAVDVDVSGHLVSPFERENLGRWLSERSGEFDIVCCSKLDRLTRNVGDFAELVKWSRGEGDSYKKVVVCVAESFDLGTPMGRMVAGMLALFAEFEWEQIRQRRLGAVETLRSAGRWKGGAVPFGYMPERDGIGWRLVQNQETASVVRRMVASAIDGQPNAAIARELNAEGIPTRTGKQWRPDTVRQVLTSKNLVGISTVRDRWFVNEPDVDGKVRRVEKVGPVRVVTDENGDPVTFTDEPLITADDWLRLESALKSRAVTGRGERTEGHLLLRVARCGHCDGARMYAMVRRDRPSGGWYRCLSCGLSVPLRKAEELVEACLLDGAGHRRLMRRVTVPGDDSSQDIARAEGELEQLRSMRSVDMSAAISALEDELDRLRALPHEPDRVDWEPVGDIKIREHWESLDEQGRGQFLRAWGVTITCTRGRTEVRLGELPVGNDDVMRDPVQQPQRAMSPAEEDAARRAGSEVGRLARRMRKKYGEDWAADPVAREQYRKQRKVG